MRTHKGKTHAHKTLHDKMDLINYVTVLFIVTLSAILSHVSGSGSLYDPPNRAVMWKYGYPTQKNYNYMQLNCGGKKQQMNGPFQCGLCGDPYELPKEHELGGTFGSGTISRYYPAGIREMHVKVELLSFEKGYFEFHMCIANNMTVTQECFDQNPLPIKEGYLAGTPMRFHPKGAGDFRLTVAIPPNLTCDRCVLQWRYHTANSWGIDPNTMSQGLGKGPQEEFRNCADIRIGGVVPASVLHNPFFAPPDARVASQIDKPTDQGKKLASHNGIRQIAAKPETIDRLSSSARAILRGVGGTSKAVHSQPIDTFSNISTSNWVDGTLNLGGARPFLVPNVENAGKRIVDGRMPTVSTQGRSRLTMMPVNGTIGLSHPSHGSAISAQNQMDRQANTIASGLRMNDQSNTVSQLDVNSNKRDGLLAIHNVLQPASNVQRRGRQIMDIIGTSGMHSRRGSHVLERTIGIDGQIGGGIGGQIGGGIGGQIGGGLGGQLEGGFGGQIGGEINNIMIGDINTHTAKGIGGGTPTGFGSHMSSGLNSQMTRGIVGQMAGGIGGHITDNIVSQKVGNLAGDIVSLTANGQSNNLLHGQMSSGKDNVNLQTVLNSILLPESLQIPAIANQNHMDMHTQTRGSELNIKGKPVSKIHQNLNINEESGWFALDNSTHPSLRRHTLAPKAGLDGLMVRGIGKTVVGDASSSGNDMLLSGGLTAQLTGGAVDRTTSFIGGRIADKGVNLLAGRLEPQQTGSHAFGGVDSHVLDGQMSSGLGSQISVGMNGLVTDALGSLLSGSLLSGGIDGQTSAVLADKISSGIGHQMSKGLGGKTVLDGTGSHMPNGLVSHTSGGIDGHMSTELANQLSIGTADVGFDSHIAGGSGGHISSGMNDLLSIGNISHSQMSHGSGNHISGWTDGHLSGGGGMSNQLSGKIDRPMAGDFGSHISGEQLIGILGGHMSGMVADQSSGIVDAQVAGGIGKVTDISISNMLAGRAAAPSPNSNQKSSIMVDGTRFSNAASAADMGTLQSRPVFDISSDSMLSSILSRGLNPLDAATEAQRGRKLNVSSGKLGHHNTVGRNVNTGKMTDLNWNLGGSHINRLTDKLNTGVGTSPSSPNIVFTDLQLPIVGEQSSASLGTFDGTASNLDATVVGFGTTAEIHRGSVGGPDIQYDQSLNAIQPNSGRQRIFLVRASRPKSVLMQSSNASNRDVALSESGQASTKSVRMSGRKTLGRQSQPLSVANKKGLMDHIRTGNSKQTSSMDASLLADSSFINNLDIQANPTFSNSLSKGTKASTIADGVVAGLRTAEVIDPLLTQSLRSDGLMAADHQFLPAGHISSVRDAHALSSMGGGNALTEIDSFRKSLITGSLRHGGGLKNNDTSSTTNQRDSSLKTKAESNKHAPKDTSVKSNVMGGLELTVSNLLREAHEILNSNASGVKDATHGSNGIHGSISSTLNVDTGIGGHAHDSHGAFDIGSNSLTEMLGGSSGHGGHILSPSTDILGHSQSNEMGHLVGASNTIGHQTAPEANVFMDLGHGGHIQSPSTDILGHSQSNEMGHLIGASNTIGHQTAPEANGLMALLMDSTHTGHNQFNGINPDSRGISQTLDSTMISNGPSNVMTPLFESGLAANDIKPMANMHGIDFRTGSRDVGSSLIASINGIGLGSRIGIQDIGSHGLSQTMTTPKSSGIFMNQAANTVSGSDSVAGIHTTVATKLVAAKPAVIDAGFGFMDHFGTGGSDIMTQEIGLGMGSAGLGRFDIINTDTLSNTGRGIDMQSRRHAQHVDSIFNNRDILSSDHVAGTIHDSTSIGHSTGTGSTNARTLGGSNIDFNSIIPSTVPAAIDNTAQPVQAIIRDRIVDLSDVISRITEVDMSMGSTDIGISSTINGGSGSMLNSRVRQSGEIQTGGRRTGDISGRSRVIGRNNQLARNEISNFMTDGLNIEQQINSFNFETIPSSSVISAGIQMTGGGGLTAGFGPRGNERSRSMRRESRIPAGIARSDISGDTFRIERDPRTGFEERIPTIRRPDAVDTRINGGERVIIHDGHTHTVGGSSRSDPEYFLDMSGSVPRDMRIVERTVIRDRPTGGRGRVSGRRIVETRRGRGRSTSDRSRLGIRRDVGAGSLMSFGDGAISRGSADVGGGRRLPLSQFRRGPSRRPDERGRADIMGRGTRISDRIRGGTSRDGRRMSSRRRGRSRRRGPRRLDEPRIVPLGARFPSGISPFGGSFPMMGGPDPMMAGPFGGMPFGRDMGPRMGPGMGPGIGMGPGMGMGDGMPPFSPMGFGPGMF